MKKFKRAYLRQWLGYTDFMGETGRGDFWRAIAVNAVILAALALLVRLWPTQFLNFLGWGYSVIMLLPTVAMLARRLHAAGRGTIWLFLLRVPAVGPAVLLGMACMKDKCYVE